MTPKQLRDADGADHVCCQGQLAGLCGICGERFHANRTYQESAVVEFDTDDDDA